MNQNSNQPAEANAPPPPADANAPPPSDANAPPSDVIEMHHHPRYRYQIHDNGYVRDCYLRNSHNYYSKR